MNDDLKEYYEFLFRHDEHRIPFDKLSETQLSDIKNMFGFAAFRFSRALENLGREIKNEFSKIFRYRK